VSFSAAARFASLDLAHRQPQPDADDSAFSTKEIREAPDEQLLFRIGEGKRDGFSELFSRLSCTVRNIGLRILRESGEADELVQDVFLYVYQKAGTFDGSKGSARSWIFQIAYTQAFMRRRKLKALGFYASGITDTTAKAGHGPCSPADYELTVEGLFGRKGWRRILESLSEEQRETLRLHFFEGYSFNEIAEKLGQSYANIRNHHYRALDRIRKNLAAEEPGKR
jgi:RNA polymerase sigma-70 factor, ECF subfamily